MSSAPVHKPISLFGWLRLFNLDVIAGAVASCLMASQVLGISEVAWPVGAVLGIAVSLIYSIDRLWDARKLKDRALTLRHQFYYKYRNLLWVKVSVEALAGLALAWVWLPGKVLLFGLGLSAVVLLYLWWYSYTGNRTLSGKYKELSGTLLFTVGVWGGLWVQASTIELHQWLLLLAFACIVFQNLLLFSFYDMETDREQKQDSLALHLGEAKALRYLKVVFVFILLIVILAYRLQPSLPTVYIVFLTMTVILFFIGIFPNYFGREARYRWLGDAVFLLPLLTILS